MWTDHTLSVLDARRGCCDFQSIYEFFTLFLVCVAFSTILKDTGAVILGDNLASLNEALKLKSTVPRMNNIAREIAWRKIALRWQFLLEHLPAELNDEADRLSRLNAVPKRCFPSYRLQGARFVKPPAQNDRLWKARIKTGN